MMVCLLSMKCTFKMRKSKRDYGFILNVLVNLALNIDGTIPAILLFALHLIFDISIMWSIMAFCLWVLGIVVWMLVFRIMVQASSNITARVNVNKNPYSYKVPKKGVNEHGDVEGNSKTSE